MQNKPLDVEKAIDLVWWENAPLGENRARVKQLIRECVSEIEDMHSEACDAEKPNLWQTAIRELSMYDVSLIEDELLSRLLGDEDYEVQT